MDESHINDDNKWCVEQKMATRDLFSSENLHPTAAFLGKILDQFQNITNWILAQTDGLFLASKHATTIHAIKEEAAQVATLSNIAEQIIGLHDMEEPFLTFLATNIDPNGEANSNILSSNQIAILLSLWNEYTLFFTTTAPKILTEENEAIHQITRELFRKFISDCPIDTASTELKVDLVKAIPFIITNVRNDPNIFSIAIERTYQLADSSESIVRDCLAQHLKDYLKAGIPADVIVKVSKKLNVEIPEF